MSIYLRFVTVNAERFRKFVTNKTCRTIDLEFNCNLTLASDYLCEIVVDSLCTRAGNV